MDLATDDIHQHDLVSFGPGLCDGGVVDGEGTPVDNVRTFDILRLDNTLVTKKASELTVIDRSYLNIAQVVASASDIGGQIGVVTGASTAVGLVRLDERGQVVEAHSGVPSSRLRRVRELGLGDLVVSGPWLGQVCDVRVDVDVSFEDGAAVCRVADAESKMLIVRPPSETCGYYYLPSKNTLFNPGQRVRSHSSSVFKDARWLRGQWNNTDDRDDDASIGTVVKVEMSGVLVRWIASRHCGTDPLLVEASAPPAYQNPHDLTFFSVAYNNFGWGPADRCFFTEPGRWTRTIIDNGDDTTDSAIAHDDPHLKSEEEEEFPKDKVEFPMTVAKTRTFVDVLWQDGTRQYGIPSKSVSPFNIINEHEFLPGHHVVDKASLDDGAAAARTKNNDDDNASDEAKPPSRIGVVRTVCCKDQTVNVSWFKAVAACPREASREVECNDTVSTYNLEKDPDDNPNLGDIVVRLLPPRSSNGTETLVESKKINVASTDLSWVGHVIDLPDSHVQVKWGDGSISTVLAHEIVVAYEEDCIELNDEPLEESDTDTPEEPTEEKDYMDNDPRIHQSDCGETNKDGPVATITSRLSSLVWSLIRLANKVLARGKGFLTIWPPPWFVSSKLLTANASGAGNNDIYAISDEKSFRFSRFDVLQSPRDHHYLDTVDEGGSHHGKSWIKTVQKEWKILQNCLPETIYVRSFEDRMDLLRVAMVGPTGTPYEDGLFFFDLQLPPTYPAVPPQVYYHSFGLRLNPNLYESGTLCLSLLNTFHGEGTEVWSPATSSLLQVLVSIQGLILNDQPYYNEAGHERQVGTPVGRRNALPYGENAYLLTLRTMLHLLRRPPQEFEGFVRDHFHRRGRFVLRTCEAYLQGCVDGKLVEDVNDTMAGRGRPSSVGLKLALANVMSSLVAAFTEIGAEGCEEFQKI